MAWAYFVEGLAYFVVMPIALIVGAILAEIGGPITDWWRSKSPFVDGGQSPLVRKCALRLASKRKKERATAVRLLHQMNDRSAVPALIQALNRFGEDAEFAELVVAALARFNDPRSLPSLRQFKTGRNASLMLAARKAVSAMEPPTILLRAADEPVSSNSALLRPVSDRERTPSSQLLHTIDT